MEDKKRMLNVTAYSLNGVKNVDEILKINLSEIEFIGKRGEKMKI